MDINLFRKSLASKQNLLTEAKKANASAEKALQESIRNMAKKLFVEEFPEDSKKEKELESIAGFHPLNPSESAKTTSLCLVALVKWGKKKGGLTSTAKVAAYLHQTHEYRAVTMPTKVVKVLQDSGYTEADILKVIESMPEVSKEKAVQ